MDVQRYIALELWRDVGSAAQAFRDGQVETITGLERGEYTRQEVERSRS